MAKQVSQETFDAVVKENMEEFEMDAEEALEDAVKQFESQGVNLSNIVKDSSLYSGGGEAPSEHPVVQAIHALQESLASEPTDCESVKVYLTKVQSECDIDLARRCMAGKHGAYPNLLKSCEAFRTKPDLLRQSLLTLASLLNGQPDLLDQQGILFLCDLLKENDADTVVLALKVIRLTCTQHEQNRQDFVAENLIQLVTSNLITHRKNRKVVKEACSVLRTLTLDDDVRVPFGKAHEHAKMIVQEADALKTLLNLSQEYVEDKGMIGELFATLSKLAVRNEFCQEILDLGGLKLMLMSLEQHMDHQGISKQAIGVLKAIAGNDNVKVAIVNAGGVELILATMNRHVSQPVVCEVGCAALATLVLRCPSHCARVMQCGGPQIITKAMQVHPAREAVQKQGCMALRNLVARARENCQPILELGAEALIMQAMSSHTGCADEGKAALRDLGCDVELTVLWKGQGVGIKH